MNRRAFSPRHLSRQTPTAACVPQPRPSEAPSVPYCSSSEPTWEDLLGRR